LRVNGVILLMETVVSRFLASSTILAATAIKFGFFKEVIASFNPLSSFFICTNFRLIWTCVLTTLLDFKVPPHILVFDTDAAPAATSAAKVSSLACLVALVAAGAVMEQVNTGAFLGFHLSLFKLDASLLL